MASNFSHAAATTLVGERDDSRTTCPNCGVFCMSREVWLEQIYQMGPADKNRLSALIRWRHLRNDPVLFLVTGTRSIPSTGGPYVTPKELIDRWPASRQGRLDSILLNLALLSPEIGSRINYHHKEKSPFFAMSDEEFRAIIDELVRAGLMRKLSGDDNAGALTLTGPGWDAADAAAARLKPSISLQGFVAMDFSDNLRALFDGPISKAIEGSGFRPFRIDAKEFNGDIVDEIVVEIRKSRFLVAEMTNHNKGVYFEAGFALGMGLPVIFTCHKSELGKDKTHFDIEHFKHVVWETEDELSRRLELRIKATLL